MCKILHHFLAPCVPQQSLLLLLLTAEPVHILRRAFISGWHKACLCLCMSFRTVPWEPRRWQPVTYQREAATKQHFFKNDQDECQWTLQKELILRSITMSTSAHLLQTWGHCFAWFIQEALRKAAHVVLCHQLQHVTIRLGLVM